jgi:hypothetical protein
MKVKFVVYHKSIEGNGGITPLTLKPWCQKEVSGQLHALITLPPGRAPMVPIEDLRTSMDALQANNLLIYLFGIP